MTLSSPQPREPHLQPRPPTPPRDHKQDIDDALALLEVDYRLPENVPIVSSADASLHTPPSTSPLVPQNGSQKSSKKAVGFKHYTIEHAGPSPVKEVEKLRPLPQIRQAKPLRSILKACNTPTPEEGSSPAGYFSPRRQDGIPKMLDSVVQMLSSEDPVLKLDGYTTINGALKAYHGVPPEAALRSRVPQLLSYISRDLRSDAGTYQTNLSTQALKLTATLFSLPDLATTLTNDFRASLLDLALQTLAQSSPNKAIANHYLYLLASAHFKTRALTAAKADALLNHLANIHERIIGNSVVATRLVIYQRLIEQLPAIMQSKIALWLTNIFHALLSTNEDICKRAIECGFKAGLEFGTHYSVTKAVSELFMAETETYGDYGTYFTKRLAEIADDEKRSAITPRIWSVIVLFFRNHRRPISHWLALKPLLMPIQTCLNSHVPDTRFEAMMAWNRLVYVTGMDTVKTDDRFVSLLKIPFSGAFANRSGNDKKAIELRKAVLFGYTNLLYYALQPEQSFERLDFFWDLYVALILPKLFKYGGRDGKYAYRVLRALLRDAGKIWDPERAHSTLPLKPEELPRLNVSWVRSRLPKILDAFEPYMEAALYASGDANDALENPFQTLIAATVQAGTQEVRTSAETKEALARLLNAMGRMWKAASTRTKDANASIFITRFGSLIETMVQAFGPNCMLEESLAISSTGIVEAVPTPAVRKTNGREMLSSFDFILGLFISGIQGCDATLLVEVFVKSLLDPVLDAQPTTTAQLALIKKSMDAVEGPANADASGIIGKVLLSDSLLANAEALAGGIKIETEPQATVSRTCSLLASILTTSLLMQGPSGISRQWMQVFERASSLASRVAGSMGTFVAISHPLADAMLRVQTTMPASVRIQSTTAILSKASSSSTSKDLLKAYKKIKGHQLDDRRVNDLFVQSWRSPFALACTACRDLTIDSSIDYKDAANFFTTMRTKLSGQSSDHLPESLQVLSDGLGPVLRDANGRLASSSAPAKAALAELVTLWKALCSRLQAQSSQKVLDSVSGLLAYAFSSRYRSIVNITIETWERVTVDGDLRVDARLHNVLQKLSEHIDIWPGLLKADAVYDGTTFSESLELLAFAAGASSDEDSQIVERDRSRDTRSVTPRRIFAKPDTALFRSRTPGKTPLSRDTLASTVSRTPPSKAHPLPKLRHENSQIEFFNVEDLPTDLTSGGGTQGLTEHQQEVQLRQQEEAAALFPQISSTPAPPSEKKNMLVVKVNEMLEREESGTKLRTPEPDAEADGSIDHFFGSSPAARSAQRAQRRSSQPLPAISEEIQPVEEQDELMDEVPSSPPEWEEDHAPAQLGEVAQGRGQIDRADEHEPRVHMDIANSTGDSNDDGQAASRGPVNGTPAPPEADTSSSSDLVKSSEFVDAPTELFNLGAETAQEAMVGKVQAQTTQRNIVNEDHPTQSPGLPPTQSKPDFDISRIEDSFVGTSDAGTTLVEPDDITAPPSTPSHQVEETPSKSRKRKATGTAAENKINKKQKTSPLRNLLSYMWPRGKPIDDSIVDDDDILDCIVVNTQPEPATAEEISQPIQAESQPSESSIPPKRKPGRPRKSINPREVSAGIRKITPAPRPGRRSKRLSSAAVSDSLETAASAVKTEEVEDSSVLSTLSSPMITRRRSKQIALQASASPVSKRSVPPVDDVMVIIPATATPFRPNVAASETGEEEDISPEKQIQAEQAAAEASQASDASQADDVSSAVEASAPSVPASPPSPSSIIGRLRGILSDVREMGKKFVLGGGEERELAGMLWELGGEVHAAGVRGRED